MQLQRSPQGLVILARSPQQVYVIAGGIVALLLPSIKFFLDLMLQTSPPTENAGLLTQGMRILILLVMLPSVSQVIAQLWRRAAAFQVQSGVVDRRNRRLSLNQFNYRWQKQTLNLPIDTIQNIQICYYGRHRGTPEAKYGLRLQLDQAAPSCIELDRGTLSLAQAQDFAQMIQRELAIPIALEPVVDTLTIAPSWFFQCLTKTPNMLTFTIDYGLMTMGLCSVFAVFGLLCIGTSPSLVAATLGAHFAFLIQLIPYITPIAIIGVMQTLGFQETWCFDRSAGKWRYERHRLLGRRVCCYVNQQVAGITVQGSSASEYGYRVAIDAPSLRLLQNNEKLRVLYQSFDPRCAHDFAQRLRYYLRLS
jgi:hypothetical protein